MEKQQPQNDGTYTGFEPTHTSATAVSIRQVNSRGFVKIIVLVVLVLLILAGGAYALKVRSDTQANKLAIQPSDDFSVQDISLHDLINSGSVGLNTLQSLSINGQLRANNSLVIAPTDRPSQGTLGQIYYDKTGNVLAYYNGTQFVDLAGTDDVTELQAQLNLIQTNISQIPGLPQGLATQSGNNTFTGTNAFTSGLSGVNLALSGAAALQGALSVNGPTNLASVSAASLNVSGATSLGPTTISSLVLSSPLAVSSGGTGTTSLTTNGIVIGQGSSPLTTVNAAGAGLCLVSTAGAPAFQACPGGGGSVVDSLNGLSGPLTLANASGVGSTVTINDATTAAKGIASFNATNFSVSSGAVNTIQNISVTSTPTFAGVTFNGNINLGSNNIVTGGATIGSGELDVLDGGITESEVTGVITDVTAGNGLTGGAASGNATVNIASANGGITVNADNIALTLQPAGDGLSATTSSGSGLEILTSGLSLLQGCSDSQILKWSEASDTWGCAADAGGSGVGDDTLVNGLNADGANFINTVASGSTAGLTWNLNTTPAPDEISITITNASATEAGVVTTGVQSFAGDKTYNNAVTVTGLFSANGGVTVEAGDTFTFNGDAFTDLSGSGLVVAGGALQAALGTTIESGEITDLTITGADIANDTITDTQLAFNTGQHLTVTSTPTFAGVTLNGNLSIGTNSIVTGATTITSTELDVLDGGITEGEVTGVITDVTAGNGLTGGAASGNATVNIASANGGIVVNSDNIALTLQPSADGLSATTSSGSGLEILAAGVSLLQGCSDNEVLKWNEATDTWNCGVDAGSGGLGDDLSVNGSNATNANFIDTVASGSTAGIAWALNTTPSPDDLSLTVSNASGAQAGVVTTGVQAFGGDKTFNNAATVIGLFTANGGVTVEVGDTFTLNGDGFTDLTGTGLIIVGSALQASLGTTIDSSEITDLTITGTDIADDTIALGTKTTGNYTSGTTGGTGIVVTGTSGEGWSPTISLDYSSTLGSNSLGVNQSSFAATGILFEGATSDGFETLFALVDPTGDNTITLPNASGTVCLVELGNCAGSGSGVTSSGGTTNRLAKFTGAQAVNDSTITDDGTNVTTSINMIIQGGNVTAGTNSQLGSFILNDGDGETTTVQAGDSTGNLTFILPTDVGDQYQCLKYDTAGQLIWDDCSGGGGGGSGVTSLNSLTGGVTIQGNSQIGVSASSPNINLSITADSIGDTQLAFNTGQHLTVTSTPTFGGLTLNGDISIGTNNIVTGATTISSVELDVLDGGIDEGEVTGVITDVTAGTGLAGGGASGAVTLNVASANGGIVVNADNIALTLQPTGDALSATTSAGSGLEILTGGLSLLQGCSDNQILKWNETTDIWACANDVDTDIDTDTGDEVSINGSGTAGANFIDTVVSGTTAGVIWNLNTTPSPDDISVTVSNASATEAGVVTTGVQSFAGDKTFNNALTVTGLFTANGNFTLETGDSFTINGDAFTDLTGTGLVIAGGVLQASLGTSIDSSEIVDLTVTGGDIANDTITDTQLAFNTGQHLTVSSTPSFAGITLTGDLSIGANNIVTSGSTISSVELDVLDGGIAEGEVTGVITDVTAGTGLTGGAASGNATLNVASANGGITVNADNIALTLQPTGDALSATTSSGSGFEILSTGLTLLQGCSDTQILKWNETADTWSCSDDIGGSGLGDNVSVNGSGASDSNFINTVVSGSSAGVTWNLNTTPSPDEISVTISNASATEAGVVTTGVQSFAGDKTFNNAINVTGLFTANGNLTVETGDTFTINGDGFTDLTGTGLNIAGGVLQAALGTSVDSSEIVDLTVTGGDIANDTITDTQLAFNTGQHLTVSSTPSFAGITLTGNLSIGANSIVTSGATISSGELDVLDGGVTEGEVTGVITDVTAGTGLTGGAASGNATIDIASANGGIVINADNIALTLQPSGNGLSSTTSSGSGLEVLASGLTLLQGCGDAQVLKWNETTDVWACANDTDSDTDTGDEVSVNGAASSGANFINSVVSGSAAGVTWNLNTTPNPDDISVTISNASATEAGVVTTGVQAFAGDKTFNNAVITTGLFTANGSFTLEAGDTLTINGDGFTDLTGTGLSIAGGVLQATLGTEIDTSEITDLTITGADIANDTITDTQLAFNTGQHLTVSSTPSFTGITLTGDLSIGANSIVTSGATISSAELNVLDGGISEGEVTGVITDVTAGTGLAGGGASGAVTLDIGSANGGIVVNADNIALTLQPSGNGLSANVSSGSGLEVLTGGLTLLQGCGDTQILKWNETTDVWACGNDAGGTGLGDDVLVNGTNADGANFLNTLATGTSAGTAWNLNAASAPDDVTLVISNASATVAGAVTTGIQSFAGVKTFGSQIVASGGIDLGTQTLQGTTAAIDFTNFDVLANGNTTIGGTLTVTQAATFNDKVGIGGTPSYKLHVTETSTANSGDTITSYNSLTANPSSAPGATTTYASLYNMTTSGSANLNANVTLYGSVSTAQNTGSASLGAAVGVGGVAQNAAGGVVTNAIAGRFKASNTGAGSITNGVALQASSPEVTAGSIGTAFGLLIQEQDVSGVGTGIGVWQAGANDLNVFAGKVGIGVVPSTYALEVNGTGTFSTSVLTPTVDTATGIALTIGGTATSISIVDDVTVAADKYLKLTGSGTRPSSPTAGTLYYDTAVDRLLVFSDGKWQADREGVILVAASDSSQEDKDAADYVTNGNTGSAGDGDQIEINAALDQADPASALRKTGKVYLFAGTYTVDGSVRIPNNVTLAGAGRSTLITIPDNFNTALDLIWNEDTSTGTGIAIQDLRLDGNKTNNTNNQSGIFLDQMGGGSGASARQGARVTNVIANNFRASGIRGHTAYNNIISGSTAQGNTTTGINFVFSLYNDITGNIAQGNGVGISFGQNSHNNTISGNKVQGNTTTGISVDAVENVTISGNMVSGSTTGISVSSAGSVNVTGNTVASNATGILLTTVNPASVSGNSLNDNTTASISLNGAHRNAINGNAIREPGGTGSNNAIYLVSSDSNNITGNSISDGWATSTNFPINITDAASDGNYIADNTYGGTGTPSINDASGGDTVYGGQVGVGANNNYVIQPASGSSIELLRNTNITGTLTATALASTVATGTAPLTVNSTTIVTNLNADMLDGESGSFYQDATNINAGTLAVNRGGSGAGTFTQYGILFGNGTGAFGVTAAGTTGQCLLATTSANPSWGTCTAGSLQSAYTASATPALVTLTDAKNLEFEAADTTTDPSIVMRLKCSTCVTGTTGNFLVQNTSGAALLSVAGNGSIQIGTANNGISLTGSGGATTGSFTLQGSARNTKKIHLTAEYAGAVLDPDSCSVNGSMTSGYTGNTSPRQNYYNWIATSGTNQCYEVIVQIALPNDWDGWSGAPSMFTYNSAGTNTTAVTVQAVGSDNTVDDNYTSYVGVSSGTTMASNNLAALDSSSYSAGGYMTLRIKMTSANTSTNVRIGNITLNYLSKY